MNLLEAAPLIQGNKKMPSFDRKTWEKEQRKNRIVDIAQDVFFKKGYQNTTMIEIAESAGYNKRTMYLYFKDKEEIFLAVVLRGLTLMHEMLKTASIKPEKESSRLMDLGKAFFEFSIQYSDYLDLVMIYESNNCVYYKDVEEKMDVESYKTKCQKKTDSIADIMIETITIGINNNTIQTSLTPIQLMLILWGQVFGVMQIILMRKRYFKDAYGISHDELYLSFLDMIGSALAKEF